MLLFSYYIIIVIILLVYCIIIILFYFYSFIILYYFFQFYIILYFNLIIISYKPASFVRKTDYSNMKMVGSLPQDGISIKRPVVVQP